MPVKSKKIEKQTAIGAVAIMLAALLWSLDGVFIRPKFYVLPAGLVVFLEHFLGLLILGPAIFWGFSKIKTLSAKSWIALIWVSVFGGLLGTLTITQAFFAAVNGETTFATVVLLQKLQPVFALLLARLVLGEKLKRGFYLWAGIAVSASYFLAFGKSGLRLSEIDFFHSAAFFAFLAAFAFGSSTVFGKRLVNHLDFKITSALRFGLTSILAFILIAATGDLFKINQVSSQQWQLLGLIVFSSGAAAMFIYYYGLKRVTASQATICELFWPFSAVILDYVLNKNVLNAVQIISAVILLVSFYQIVKTGKAKNLFFTAKVIHGSGRGKSLGFPTANLDKIDLDLSYGVYLAEAEIDAKKYPGLLHFGLRETFQDRPSLEIYLKDFQDNIYQKEMKVKIIQKIREVKKFQNSADLVEQIKKDAAVLP